MVFIETSVATKAIQQLFDDEEYRRLQEFLAGRPDAGVVIKGGGGIRKLRWARPGRGKSGGARVIYYWVVGQDQILMLLAYPKSAQDDLTDAQVKTLARLVEGEFHGKETVL